MRGDLIGLKIGDVVPADCILVGNDLRQSCEVDQAALTGESLPATKHTLEKLLMGSVIKRGEQQAVVVGTGERTFFGKAAEMISSVEHKSRFQVILFHITMWLMAIALLLGVIMFIKLVVMDTAESPQAGSRFLRALSIVVVLLVASIPIAMQVVSTATMAIGAHKMAEKKIIVARLGAIEELAGMNVLCSDKTGTLTKNKLELRDPCTAPQATMGTKEMHFFAALAANKDMANNDAIDFCICNSVVDDDSPTKSDAEPAETTEAASSASGSAAKAPFGAGSASWAKLCSYEQLDFLPFNPTDKRVEITAKVPADTELPGGEVSALIKVTKGAPQVVLKLALEDPNCIYSPQEAVALKEKVSADIQELADRGFRCLGVAHKVLSEGTAANEDDLEGNTWSGWRFQGLISLFDPPRDDTKETIRQAMESGVEVKMITGDQTAIAKETCRELGMGVNILDSNHLHTTSGTARMEMVMGCNGFAEVMPEDKFSIVESVRGAGNVVGMTGDGVNDAPALKRADIGIAVEGATGAAKAAADIVLTEPGLGVIIDAMEESRKIFQRMRNYVIYRVSSTIELLLFFFVAVMFINVSDPLFFGAQPSNVCWGSDCPDGRVRPTTEEQLNAHFNVFTLPVIALVVITILNDGTMITIAYDKVEPESRPQKWKLGEVAVVASALGAMACLTSIVLLLITLQASVVHDSWAGRVFGANNLNGHHFVTFGEVQTLLYLKVSLSDFLTVFNARNRGWFWERLPGQALSIAAFGAMGASTLFALFWPFEEHDVTSFNKYAYMSPLSGSKYGVVVIWAISLLSFLLQDLVKVAAFAVLHALNKEEEDSLQTRQQQVRIGNKVSRGDKRHRLKLVKTMADSYEAAPFPGALSPAGVAPSGSSRDLVTLPRSELSSLQERLASLEAVVAALQKQSGGAGGAAE